MSTHNFQCDIDENEAFWILFEVAEAGYLTFTLSPQDDPMNDLDFAVFLPILKYGCEDKKLLRCMNSGVDLLSGNSISENSLPCIGATGLSITEKDDKEEYAGCQQGDNNFLAPIDCVKGGRYLLAVSSYGEKKHDFILELCGTAMLSCDSIHCEEITPKLKKLPFKQEVLFPNKAWNGTLPITFYRVKPQPVMVRMRNVEGGEWSHAFIKVKEEQDTYGLSVDDLSQGEYEIEIELRRELVKGRFFKK